MPTNGKQQIESREYLKKATGSAAEIEQWVKDSVSDILQEVRENGDSAILSFTEEFDDVVLEDVRVSQEEIDEAREMLSAEEKAVIDRSIERVANFAEAQKDAMKNDFESEFGDGIRCGQRTLPVSAAGTYVPGGNFTHIASAVMSITPATVAGVDRIVTCTPPREDGSVNAYQLYAMAESGVDEIYKIGGAQAIGAMAYGTESIDSVDIVTGPGNVFVVEAKRQVFGDVDLDLLPGPTETLIIADETTDPHVAAVDLLSQAEHTESSQCVLISTDEGVAEEILEEIEDFLPKLDTEETARKCWTKNGEVAVVTDYDQAAALANEYAIEHVQVMTENPRDLVENLKNYGSLFLGHNAPVVFGDKITGPNHILPTNGTARFNGGCNVGSYLKKVTHQEITPEGGEYLSSYGAKISELEGMHGHQLSAELRPVERD
ncbi:histidinol dehydrogenase [Halosolutus halophilus]|uniref:histidinol dehydrogenase n=1 Tax=Halosolutus halophilus TaxID=1552990 RepID=UPI0022351B1D|nr:histidinol dehydrogenase [Halosolutus halophilus]